ncbi:hypothetical protein BDN70DRAFT_594922 [Pholiota conissans]|uniref:Heterokaryon incompatibility domain-containing protein n=1 Tax=Pholiota conissans TaxID=109636 RepID=A0A9P5Z3J3_9AGAR|nr:hypothetical protein BDN70DRAFT_594922 [Pholiota conissans]
MAPKRFEQGNPSTRSNMGDDTDRDANTQDQILLKALQEFIVPLVQTVVDPTGAKAMDFTGAEAINLITALKNFVSSVAGRTVHVEDAPRRIQIQKNEEENADTTTELITRFDKDLSLSRIPPGVALFDTGFYKKLLNGLRQHVSNKMPIRLLLIEPRDSYLQISLIDRGGIYAHLENVIRRAPIERNGDTSYQTDEEFIESTIQSYAKYAILSHTWLRGTPGEITYDLWTKGPLDLKSAGYKKLAGLCRTVWKEYGLTLAWMDTICINKDSSSELDESIRSMYAWYERAGICIAYLSETHTTTHIPDDTWFTRGWTLQELIAPKKLKFYSAEWNRLAQDHNDDKKDPVILGFIKQATTLSSEELTGKQDVSLSRRMQWATSREVTREEDMAYSLMGIFNVSISIAYGEGGSRAFLRLLEEIMKSCSGSMDLFNWAGSAFGNGTTGLLPPSPKYYLHRSTDPAIRLDDITLDRPLTLTPRGINVSVVLIPGISIGPGSQDSQQQWLGDYGAIVEVLWPPKYDNIPTTFCLLHKSVSKQDGYSDGSSSWDKPWAQLTFVVLNTWNGKVHSIPGGSRTPSIHFPTMLMAVVLNRAESFWVRIPTMKPVIFELKYHNTDKINLIDGHDIPTDQLERHGMDAVSFYL